LDEELHKVLIQPNGDIVAVGYYENAMEEDDLVLIRLTDSLPPTAQLTADPLSGCWPLTIHYFDKSIGNPASWQWSFPGGVPATSTERNPTVVYNQPGTYSATLTVSNSLGNSTITSTDIITVNAPPTADFTYTTNGNDVAFLNTTSGVTTANWNFGDGTTSTSNSPGHT
jgi:PKD repeat protein